MVVSPALGPGLLSMCMASIRSEVWEKERVGDTPGVEMDRIFLDMESKVLVLKLHLLTLDLTWIVMETLTIKMFFFGAGNPTN